MADEERVKGLKDEGLDLTKLEDPGDRYELGDLIGTGVTAQVYQAKDNQAGGMSVAVKIQTIKPEFMADIEEEYKILRDLSDHPNLPDFYGAYRKIDRDRDTIWFVMQLCEGGQVTDMVRALSRQAKKMNELHIAFIIREVIKALTTLHENHVIHRDVKASNILLTKNGEVKLVDFGLARELSSTMGKRQTCLGSPCWMAPEVVTSKGTKGSYDNRADVWALGITAIELGDGKAPFQDMHPTRALFQIVRNPPPTLYRPANWTQNYNDFISECLVKNPEHRPYMAELMEHPFLADLPDNDHHLNAELRTLLEAVTADDKRERKPEVRVKTGLLQRSRSVEPEQMHQEDLAALESINEESIMHHLEARFKKGQYYTYVGDILLFLNPNKALNIYGFQNYNKYKFKSRSDNEPHIFGVADSAYQDMLHHNVTQSIIISGETTSGKTSQCKQIIRHLTHLGMCNSKISEKVLKGVDLLHAFGNAATPENPDSTRHASVTQVTFSNTGKLSGAIFWIFQLEKFRVTGSRSPYHANFHVFYYFFDALKNAGELDKYKLDDDTDYCYLRRDISDEDKDIKVPPGPRDDPDGNVAMFKRLSTLFADLDFSPEDLEFVWRTLAAIILLGEIKYKDDGDKNADIEDTGVIEKISTLLAVDCKRLSWALCNYCVVEQDTAARRRHSRPEALLARNVFAQNLYSRLVDWIVNNLNQKLSLTRAIYGDHHCINIMDIFGFECYPDNSLEQLFVNSMNEQIQYFYNQKIFISEMLDEEEDEVECKKLQFYDNRETIDELMNKPNGVLHVLDEANKLHQEGDFVVGQIKRRKEGNHVKAINEEEFTVAHYTGKVTYNAISMCSKNRDFLPPEMTEVMRMSTDPIVKQLFTNKLSRTGNVTIILESAENITASDPKDKGKKRWGALLMDSKGNVRRYNTVSKGEFSQTKGIRTASATFRSTCLELLRLLSQGTTHFVRCLRTDLSRNPEGFQTNIVKQQLRGLAVIDTARARKTGFSHRITFDKFMDGYQFLAFDFDENVDKTKDNCRLLMIRLKMEGWRLGNTKVFLKYYNEEFLSRLYETQVKKIVKVQSMLRAFLAKRSVAKKKTFSRESSLTGNEEKIPEE
uniref:Neither inactivation nor afterpotential protein C n=1 Tax=Lygus hesperus TaxID=30085 RepID=A0A0A9Z196_LYGHE